MKGALVVVGVVVTAALVLAGERDDCAAHGGTWTAAGGLEGCVVKGVRDGVWVRRFPGGGWRRRPPLGGRRIRWARRS